MDVGFGNIYPLFGTPGNVGFDSLTTRGLLTVAYAAGEHEQILPSGPECFLATWESRAEARSIRPPETGAEATNAYNTALSVTVYRLCGNSIPVLALRGAIEHIATNIIKPQVLTTCAEAAEAHRAARREKLETLQAATV